MDFTCKKHLPAHSCNDSWWARRMLKYAVCTCPTFFSCE
ncbi:hypothetical protein COLO4_04815 [Corchorus olitorius]|uniref:Uncharacterized protein n=1 Tax=Corchorus olitorius TaxID=93759 RepID=A0A1R3KSS4_9ROSI|nr:hypothetical protein COLO4_04815 [Corchorus olitorius]